MRGEIVQLQLGKCGNQIGQKVWEDLCGEHGIDPSGACQSDSDIQLDHINVYFKEGKGGAYGPRNLFMDNDPTSNEGLMLTPFGEWFSTRSQIVSGRAPCECNWARGYHTIGSIMIDKTLDAIQKEVEECESISAFQLIHSLGGGTGSGFGSLLLQRLREEYPKQILSTVSVLDSDGFFTRPNETYNTLLSVKGLVEICDSCLLFDNNALERIYTRKYPQETPTMEQTNRWISTALGGVTSTLRLPSTINPDLRKLSQNMAPYAGLPFLTVSMSPILQKGWMYGRPITHAESLLELFSAGSNLCGVDQPSGRYLSACYTSRGRSSNSYGMEEWHEAWSKIHSENTFSLPDCLMATSVDIPPRGLKRSALLLSKNTAVKEVWNHLLIQYRELFRKQCLVDLIEEYQLLEDEPLSSDVTESTSNSTISKVEGIEEIGSS